VTEGLLGWLGGLGFLVLIAMWLTAKRRDKHVAEGSGIRSGSENSSHE
jgi:Trk-type K+ transport system membrane component